MEIALGVDILDASAYLSNNCVALSFGEYIVLEKREHFHDWAYHSNRSNGSMDMLIMRSILIMSQFFRNERFCVACTC